MLHGDRAERRERLRLLEHPLGEVRVQAHALPLAGAERPGLVPDRVRDARAGRSRARARRGAACAPRRRRARAARPAAAASSATAREWPSVYGDFRSTKFAIASSAASNRSPREHDRERRLGVDHRVPGADRVEAGEDHRRPRRTSERRRAPGRTACRPRLRASALAASTPPTRCATSTYSASCAIRDGDRDRPSPASSPGQPAPVPLLVRRAERLEHRRRAARAARPSARASAACWAIMPSTSRWPESANSSPTRKRCSGGLPGAEQPQHRGRRRARSGTRGRTCRTSARCRRRTTSPARARRCGSRR